MEGHQDTQGLEHLLCEVVDDGRLRDNKYELKQKSFRLDKRKLFHNEDTSSESGCPEMWYTLHPWMFSRADRIKPSRSPV